jgi:hypothetical protein
MGSWAALFAEQALSGLVVGLLLRALSQVSERYRKMEERWEKGVCESGSRKVFRSVAVTGREIFFMLLSQNGNFFLWFSEDVSFI